jgi:hypothetical protein
MGPTMAERQLGWLATRLQEVRARIDTRRAGWTELAAVSAYTGEGEHPNRSIMNAPIGDRDRSRATLGVGG